MPSREGLPVELVDEAGRAIGECRVDEAHQPPGRLHRAFSVLLREPSAPLSASRVLLQQRASVKTRFSLRWANTCCGHPAPGQPVAAAANDRLRDELGVGPLALTEIGTFVYRAQDPTTGRLEYEYDHVLVGELSADQPLHPSPGEVADLRWIDLTQLRSELQTNPDIYTPWLAGVTETYARWVFGDRSDGSDVSGGASTG
ncbi:MAG TPA: isopentenyl-diphosphate Delta-isomerase [Micromonosporaceae bacterium]|nr:isopentenyl-diphosphate Delta-isomerase [Micromonosporaceae bacterium]